ncbi:hypothetical protein [Methylobacter sp. S3L5C]|uniref:hypothetical protein n=1 Tax=Methylobacter sp. S3L5C TaxID=2839024 RepID=UPI001FAB9FDE|nr:hypothetical protein [Methylobacter sp. S3L5C]UOA08586.1 hypothetical protein KKZ03_20745 [Methylobacter sp. S3L5C]
MKPSQPITLSPARKARLSESIAQQNEQRGITPMPLEQDTLLRRIKAGGWSGQFLGQAYLSVYFTDKPFNLSLGKLINLDAEGFRLFHQILHVRHISGWNDDALWDLAIEVRAILAKESGHVSPSQE